jgi:cell division protein FtsW
MKTEKKSIDYIFLTITSILVIIGIFVFFSASLGVLARDEGKFYQILISQIALGLVGGAIALYVCTRIPYRFWRERSAMILIAGIGLTLLVFVPHLGFAHGGARRWVSIFGISFQAGRQSAVWNFAARSDYRSCSKCACFST